MGATSGRPMLCLRDPLMSTSGALGAGAGAGVLWEVSWGGPACGRGSSGR